MQRSIIFNICPYQCIYVFLPTKIHQKDKTMKRTIIWIFMICMAQFAFAQMSPYTGGIDKGSPHVVSNSYINGFYNEATGALEMACKKDLEQLDILIYKNGKLCEKESNKDVKENDRMYYQLSDYGTGVFTICTENKKVLQVAGTIVYKE